MQRHMRKAATGRDEHIRAAAAVRVGTPPISPSASHGHDHAALALDGRRGVVGGLETGERM
eukprot:6543556-Prymnesium_polylepis.1